MRYMEYFNRVLSIMVFEKTKDNDSTRLKDILKTFIDLQLNSTAAEKYNKSEGSLTDDLQFFFDIKEVYPDKESFTLVIHAACKHVSSDRGRWALNYFVS